MAIGGYYRLNPKVDPGDPIPKAEEYEFSTFPTAIRYDYAIWEKIKAKFKRKISDKLGHEWKQINPIFHYNTVYYCMKCQAGSSYPHIFMMSSYHTDPVTCDEFLTETTARKIMEW